jgi:aryl-alcohol dehydrogenase-like predicted oxidoreductase
LLLKISQSFGLGGGENMTNEELVGKAIKQHGRENLIIATKFGIGFADGKTFPCGKEEFLRGQLADSLKRLDTNYIDLYYMHRMDPNTPIEETMQVLKSLVEEGVIRYIGLSEVTPEELRRAHAIHPITAIQMEWSLQTRSLEKDIVPIARELGIGIVAYSPLGRGFLADMKAFEHLEEGDSRRNHPRFRPENLQANQERVRKLYEMAEKRQCTPAQLALAWVHSRGDDVFPIPGTKHIHRIEENAGAFALLPLTTEEMKELEESVEALIGDRYPEAGMQTAFENRLQNL